VYRYVGARARPHPSPGSRRGPSSEELLPPDHPTTDPELSARNSSSRSVMIAGVPNDRTEGWTAR
jgi:hypothetical protein